MMRTEAAARALNIYFGIYKARIAFLHRLHIFKQRRIDPGNNLVDILDRVGISLVICFERVIGL